jgi:hypothetical protein
LVVTTLVRRVAVSWATSTASVTSSSISMALLVVLRRDESTLILILC